VTWTAFWTAAMAVVLGLVSNEIGDVAPWLARKILRRASRWEAEGEAEADLIFGEQLEFLESIPGRITKLVWAVGRLRFGLRFSLARSKRRRQGLPPIWPFRVSAYGMAVKILMDVSPAAFGDPSFLNVTMLAVVVGLWVVLAFVDGPPLWRRWKRWRREQGQ
jgi:hypothetical protein